MKIKICIGDFKLEANLNGSKTANRIFDSLPIKGFSNRWGDEIYFEVPIHINIEERYAKEVVKVGDLGFWPSGSSFCIFFGKTPASTGEEPRAASAVNVFGKVIGDSTLLRKTKSGEKILIETL